MSVLACLASVALALVALVLLVRAERHQYLSGVERAARVRREKARVARGTTGAALVLLATATSITGTQWDSIAVHLFAITLASGGFTLVLSATGGPEVAS